jgi:cephalosporin hydroxylase
MKYLEESAATPLGEILPLIQDRIVNSTFYFGVRALKNPLDFWVYQELIWQSKPTLIIEVGNNFGGSTLALAHLLDLIGNGRVVAIDIDHSRIHDKVKEHPRITLIEGDACAVFDRVRAIVRPDDRILIIEDSSHTYENTFNVLAAYSTLLKSGEHFVVEDSICHHGLDVGPDPGPFEAIEEFVSRNADFEIDRSRESFVITWNPKGFLTRK